MANPTATVNELIEAINHGDVEKAIRLYEPDAVLVAQPGQIARGTEQIRKALGGFVAMKATLRSSSHSLVETGDLALYIGRWSLTGADPAGKPIQLSGESTDILRRSRDGEWLIAVDNPWGSAILPPSNG